MQLSGVHISLVRNFTLSIIAFYNIQPGREWAYSYIAEFCTGYSQLRVWDGPYTTSRPQCMKIARELADPDKYKRGSIRPLQPYGLALAASHQVTKKLSYRKETVQLLHNIEIMVLH